jgi:hypothetical protein
MEELLRRLDKPYIRVKTKNKIPRVLDWVNHAEKQSIEELLKENGEYGLRTGTKIGNYWFCALDIDKQGWTKLFKSWQSYIKTFRGIHVYCLIREKEPPSNSILYYRGKRIGDLLSKGKQIIGVESKHTSGVIYQLIKNGKWFMKLESIEVLKQKLNGWDIELR